MNIDTLNYDAVGFVRDVLRQNLTDLQSPTRTSSNWIFKSVPEEREFDPPIVIVNTTREDRSNLTLGRKIGPPILVFDVRIWARKIYDRDKLADQTVAVLSNSSSADSAGTTLKQNYLFYKTSSQYDEDGYIGGFPNIMRIKRVIVEFRFIAW